MVKENPISRIMATLCSWWTKWNYLAQRRKPNLTGTTKKNSFFLWTKFVCNAQNPYVIRYYL